MPQRLQCYACSSLSVRSVSQTRSGEDEELTCPNCGSTFVECLPDATPAAQPRVHGVTTTTTFRPMGRQVEVTLGPMGLGDHLGQLARGMTGGMGGLGLPMGMDVFTMPMFDGGFSVGAPGDFLSGPALDELITRLMDSYRPPVQRTAPDFLAQLPRLRVSPAAVNGNTGDATAGATSAAPAANSTLAAPATAPATGAGSSVETDASANAADAASTAAGAVAGATASATAAATAAAKRRQEFASVAAGEPCVVCHDAFDAGDEVVQLPCKHCFHEDCVMPWLREHNTCPTCRTKMPTDSQPSPVSGEENPLEHHHHAGQQQLRLRTSDFLQQADLLQQPLAMETENHRRQGHLRQEREQRLREAAERASLSDQIFQQHTQAQQERLQRQQHRQAQSDVLQRQVELHRPQDRPPYHYTTGGSTVFSGSEGAELSGTGGDRTGAETIRYSNRTAGARSTSAPRSISDSRPGDGSGASASGPSGGLPASSAARPGHTPAAVVIIERLVPPPPSLASAHHSGRAPEMQATPAMARSLAPQMQQQDQQQQAASGAGSGVNRTTATPQSQQQHGDQQSGRRQQPPRSVQPSSQAGGPRAQPAETPLPPEVMGGLMMAALNSVPGYARRSQAAGVTVSPVIDPRTGEVVLAFSQDEPNRGTAQTRSGAGRDGNGGDGRGRDSGGRGGHGGDGGAAAAASRSSSVGGVPPVPRSAAAGGSRGRNAMVQSPQTPLPTPREHPTSTTGGLRPGFLAGASLTPTAAAARERGASPSPEPRATSASRLRPGFFAPSPQQRPPRSGRATAPAAAGGSAAVARTKASVPAAAANGGSASANTTAGPAGDSGATSVARQPLLLEAVAGATAPAAQEAGTAALANPLTSASTGSVAVVAGEAGAATFGTQGSMAQTPAQVVLDADTIVALMASLQTHHDSLRARADAARSFGGELQAELSAVTEQLQRLSGMRADAAAAAAIASAADRAAVALRAASAALTRTIAAAPVVTPTDAAADANSVSAAAAQLDSSSTAAAAAALADGGSGTLPFVFRGVSAGDAGDAHGVSCTSSTPVGSRRRQSSIRSTINNVCATVGQADVGSTTSSSSSASCPPAAQTTPSGNVGVESSDARTAADIAGNVALAPNDPTSVPQALQEATEAIAALTATVGRIVRQHQQPAAASPQANSALARPSSAHNASTQRFRTVPRVTDDGSQSPVAGLPLVPLRAAAWALGVAIAPARWTLRALRG